MRVAIVTESFLPHVNGVTNTVRHTADRLLQRGHRVLIIAPGPGPTRHGQAQVVRIRSVPLPGYRSFSLGLPDAAVERALADFSPDVVHLASPIMVGVGGLRAARRLGIPTVAIYQTDVAAFARRYGVRALPVERWVARIHRRSSRTLVPSSASHRQLEALGVPNLHLWRRGVSLDLFGPEHRSVDLHRRFAKGGDEVVIGYVGRLAAEKQVRRLVELADLPGTRLVVIGDGPLRPWLEQHLPHATFTGMLAGAELATAFASLDVFVHPGEDETFCQTVQEAQASGVPVVAPASGGPLDLIDHERTGLLYDPRDRTSLRSTVESVVADPVMRWSMAWQARRQVAGRTWVAVVDELVDVHYAAVLPPDQRELAA
ncbi:MAG: glycosyltransferase family 1 protein [Marmoricola sp.]|jgi:phosphatidylinositol alpha 1,6-mannosyltransferase|nr:glycosyltransferase family 1 protein [Marmoricola sp.]